MRAKFGWGLIWGAIVLSCFAAHSRKAAAGNCALYARAVTGVDLHGAAGSWWYRAAGHYPRGQVPAPGSILVFRPTRAMPSGHVAVVTKVVGPSMVLVDQSNWYHGRVTLGTPVADTSPNHDWTTVAVMNLDSGQLGRDNPTYGFVYPQNIPSQHVSTASSGPDSPAFVTRIAYDPSQQAGLFHFVIAEDDLYRGARGRRTAHRKTARHSHRHTVSWRWHAHAGWHPRWWNTHAAHATAHHALRRTTGTSRHDPSDRVASAR
jgi:surface antigen